MLVAVVLLLIVIMFFPAGWTTAEQIAAKQGYLKGLTARLTDPVLWKRALVACAGFACLMAVVAPVFYYLSIALRLGRRRLGRD